MSDLNNFFNGFISIILRMSIYDVVDITIVAYIFYKIFMFTIVAAFVIVYMYRMIWGEGDIVVFKPRDSIIWRIIKSL